MSGFWRCSLLVAVLLMLGAAPAWTQENVEAGKTPAQLYASDCTICHKTPHGLTKAGGLFGLTGFLQEHYTASRESAAAIAKYLESTDRPEPPAAVRKRTHSRPAKGDEKPNGKNAKDQKAKAD